MNFAIIPAAGIGDALIMLIASHHLRKMGHSVTTFHSQLASFGRWLESGEYRAMPDIHSLLSFDAILLQHDNTLNAQLIVSLRNRLLPIYVFYPTYRFSKHGPLLDSFDYAFDPNQSMVENCRWGTQKLFGGSVSIDNGLHPLPGLTHRKNKRRVLMHPTSGSETKNWPKKKFLRLAQRLQQMHFHPLFILSPKERSAWPEVEARDTPTLEELASTIYESDYFIGNDSGPGHLASYLSIPYLIIGQNERTMRQWRPGWHRGEIIYPPRYLPNLKGFRLREEHWKHFVSTKSVLNRFISIVK
jgi:ADP-heptose:LPS heptosyltransferase